MSNLPVPNPRQFNAGETEVSAYLNSLAQALSFLLNPPICAAVQATVQSVPNATWTSLTLDATIEDSYGGHSNTTNNSRYTAVVAGWCIVAGSACWSSNVTSTRGARIAHNGTAVQGGATVIPVSGSGTYSIATPAVLVYLAVGDYVEVQGFQNSGGALSTGVNTDADSALTVAWVHV